MSVYTVFDVETPNRYNNRMSAIGITVIEDGRIVSEFYSLVNPETFFDRFNVQLTGIDEQKVRDAPAFAELWSEIEPIMSRGVLTAHNAVFDLGVLRKCLQSSGIVWKPAVPYLCTVQIGRRVLPGMKHSLDVMCRHFGIPLNHHQADSDSRACAELLLRYMACGTDVRRFVREWRMG